MLALRHGVHTQKSQLKILLIPVSSSGEIETGADLNYASDLFLTEADSLVVGSWTETARIYNQDLMFVGPLGTDQRMFVTQYISAQPKSDPNPQQRCRAEGLLQHRHLAPQHRLQHQDLARLQGLDPRRCLARLRHISAPLRPVGSVLATTRCPDLSLSR